MRAQYDEIGRNYASLRRPDPRIAAQIHAALGDAETVLNVGAGAGSYEPADRQVTALEPSSEMIRQRPAGSAPVIQGVAEALPYADDSFDAVMAVLTIHHWTDKPRGLTEMQRVSKGPVVILTYDPAFRDFWLFDYFPGLTALDDRQMPTLSEVADWLGAVEISPVPIPKDCTDGFLCAYWQRPHAYLDPERRKAISSFWKIGDVTPGLEQLKRDLDSGAWEEKYGACLSLEARDCGYRLVVAKG